MLKWSQSFGSPTVHLSRKSKAWSLREHGQNFQMAALLKKKKKQKQHQPGFHYRCEENVRNLSDDKPLEYSHSICSRCQRWISTRSFCPPDTFVWGSIVRVSYLRQLLESPQPHFISGPDIQPHFSAGFEFSFTIFPKNMIKSGMQQCFHASFAKCAPNARLSFVAIDENFLYIYICIFFYLKIAFSFLIGAI